MTLLTVALLTGCNFTKKQSQTEPMPGSDRDSHGCIASAGYLWSEVRNDCIRLFETGIRLESPEEEESAFLVFSVDSSKVELFFSDDSDTEILDKKILPEGGYEWSGGTDDTRTVRQVNGLWTIFQKGNIQYIEEAEAVESSVYEGVLPAPDCKGIRYFLTVQASEEGGDGCFILVQTYLGIRDGEDDTFTSVGKRHILKGDATNKKAIVWQFVPENGDDPVNFLVQEDGKKLVMLNKKLKPCGPETDYTIKKVDN